MIGGYEDGSADGAARPKWRSVSLQGCPREVRRLLAGPYYFDVDMVNSLPNVARQLGRRGMVGAANLRALGALCSERDTVLADIVEFYGLTDEPAQGVTARDRAKDLPIRILHGGGLAAWLDAQGLPDTQQVLPLVKQLEAELRVCRREVYEYMQQHDSEWLRVVEDHVRGAQAPRPGAGAVTGPRATTAAARGAPGRRRGTTSWITPRRTASRRRCRGWWSRRRATRICVRATSGGARSGERSGEGAERRRRGETRPAEGRRATGIESGGEGRRDHSKTIHFAKSDFDSEDPNLRNWTVS